MAGERTTFNAVLLLQNGIIVTKRFKHLLPTYGVFDEDRVFSRGPIPGPIPFNGVRLGVMICEDMWREDVAEGLQESGAELLLVMNGSPFEVDKPDQRINLAAARVGECNLPLAYINLVGGQDESCIRRSFIRNQSRSRPQGSGKSLGAAVADYQLVEGRRRMGLRRR